MVRDSAASLLCADFSESVTRTVRAAADSAVAGTPLMVPVDAFKERPAGSVPLATAQV